MTESQPCPECARPMEGKPDFHPRKIMGEFCVQRVQCPDHPDRLYLVKPDGGMKTLYRMDLGR